MFSSMTGSAPYGIPLRGERGYPVSVARVSSTVEHDEHNDADQRHQDQVTDGSAAHRDLPKLNARSIDDPPTQ